MKLNKAHPNELYQWWVVASLALQAHAAAVQARLAHPAAADTTSSSSQQSAAAAVAGGAGAGLASDKLLALAEAMAGRLLGKAPAQGGQHSWESAMLYLGLLQAQVGAAAASMYPHGVSAHSMCLRVGLREGYFTRTQQRLQLYWWPGLQHVPSAAYDQVSCT